MAIEVRWLLFIAIGGLVSLLILLVRGRKDRADLGSVSKSWIVEHRTDQPHQ